MRYLGLALTLLIASVAPASAVTFNTIKTFCVSGCTDGETPNAPLVMDSSGVLYGTTTVGGADGDGVVYELSGATETVLHSCCSQTNCKDGEMPVAGAILDSSGDLYGTTSAGGRGSSGTAFEISP
jgi:uncharacterized repeat protein (TIGR03803 family)